MHVGRSVCWVVSAFGCTLILCIAACGGGGGGGGGEGGGIGPIAAPPAAAAPPQPAAASPVVQPVPATSRVVADSITSANTGAVYTLEIYLPASYGASTTVYPVIYAMDGDAIFNPPGSRFANFRAILEAHNTQAILVGVGGTSRRERDYLMPGAQPYHEFLTQELVPHIEGSFRADASTRVLTGLSLSGSMTGVALFLEGASGALTFTHFLSFEGSFDSQTDENNDLEQKMYDARGTRPLPATLILTRCDNPQECNFGNVNDMYERLRSRAYPAFALTQRTYPDTHVGTDLPSFTDAIGQLFP
ncbi:hypothetical protein SAMN05444746_13616 [Variovorax sp. OK212]|nr:hypothetical protein SAMN05518853_13716 [Variovorax sp. OK202]SFE74830.1 hypothetical protein SAMN05444746_13616 [Variovorax sp. OK212]